MKRAVVWSLTAALVVAACGKVGPPQPAGPPDKILYPHAYPTYHIPP